MTDRRYLLALTVLALVLFFFKVDMPLTDGDTAYYARIAQHILKTGDWITLHCRGNDFVDKPPLSIWGIAASYKLFGVSNWATRGWHSLLAVLSVLLTYAVARRFYGAWEAFLGGAILATTFLMAYMGQVPQQDVPLVFACLLAFLALARYLERRRLLDALAFSAAVALAVLDRGLQGLVFPVGVVLVYAGLRLVSRRSVWFAEAGREGAAPGGNTLATGKDSLHPALAVVAGAVVFGAIAVPWFYLGYLRQGPEFLNYFLGSGNARYLRDIAPGSAWGRLSYIPMLLIAFLPWTGFVFHTAALAWREARGGSGAARERDAALFLGAWFLVALLLPMTIQWRVIRYLLPALPPLAILTGHFLAQQLRAVRGAGLTREFHRGSFMTLAAGAFLVVAVAASVKALPAAQAGVRPVLVPFLLAYTGTLVAAALAALALRRPAWSVAVLAAGALLSYLVLFGQLDRHHYLVNPWTGVERTLNAEASPQDLVVHLGSSHSSMLDYGVKGAVEVEDVPTLEEALRRQAERRGEREPAGRLFLVGPQEALADALRAHPGVPFRLETYPGGQALAVLSAR